MSIRIHKLAEELGLDNKEMMTLLKERKIIAADVKSVSSTVDNINAQVLREEFAKKNPAAAPAAPAPEKPAAPPIASVEAASGPAPKVVLPSNVFVKSKQEVDREKEAVAAAKAAALKSPAPAMSAPVTKPAPIASAPM